MPPNFIDFTENYHSNKPIPPLCWPMKADPVQEIKSNLEHEGDHAGKQSREALISFLFLRFDIQLFILKPPMKADTGSDVNQVVLGLTLSMEIYTVSYRVISSLTFSALWSVSVENLVLKSCMLDIWQGSWAVDRPLHVHNKETC